jgi:hypothetical protein
VPDLDPEARFALGLLLTVPAAAERVGVSTRQFWRWIADGEVPVERVEIAGQARTLVPVASLAAAPVPVDRGRRSPAYGTS